VNILRKIVVGIALTAALPATAATTINFDQLPNGTALPSSGTTISTQYASLGVTFLGTNTASGATGALNSWGLIAASGLGGSGNYLGNFGAIPGTGVNNYLIAPRYDVTSMLFTNAVGSVSFGLNTSGGQNSVTINAYDAQGVLLQTKANVMANQGSFEVQTLTASGIAKIDVVGAAPGGAVRLYGIDNLTYTVSAVPEPATWAMMLGGFGMTGMAMRRRKKRTTVFA
jgi:hypothetical protein